MKNITRISNIRLRGGFRCAFVVILLGAPCIGYAQTYHPSSSGDMMVCESSGASRVIEQVRSSSQGVMADLFVKPGDVVVKGQILGHTELDATKLQLDLAKSALDAKANVEAAKGQADAWSVAREETEEAVRRHKSEKTRLEWATAMEKMYRGTYEVQLEAEKTQLIQYEYWKSQYEKRFFRAPVDGVVSEVLVELGKNVNIATHVFTITNDSVFLIPLTVPADIVRTPVSGEMLPVRPANSKSDTTRAQVDSVVDNPSKAGDKIIRLLVPVKEFSATLRSKLLGVKFEVLLPLASR